MSARAGILVTGTEVLTGRVTDRNGPWLAERLRLLGVDVARVVVVGDRPADMRTALTQMDDLDLVITSGGLGPTEDDLTVAVVAATRERSLVLDEALQQRIADRVAEMGRHRGRVLDPAVVEPANRKQAMVPEGATVLEPVGTAPGVVVPGTPPVVVLPGPPSELQPMWQVAESDPLVRSALSTASPVEQRTLRIWGSPEADLAASLRRAGDLSALELTTCVRTGELEVVARLGPASAPVWEALRAHLLADFGEQVFAPDGHTVDELVASALAGSGRTVATGESCTGGLLAARLTEVAGSSGWVLGGLVSYADRIKVEQLGVPAEVVAEHGAVSEPVARAMAEGVRARLGSSFGVSITGVAGPGGGSEQKPVGLVHLAVAGPDGTRHHRMLSPGSRVDVRARSVQQAMHLLRRSLG